MLRSCFTIGLIILAIVISFALSSCSGISVLSPAPSRSTTMSALSYTIVLSQPVPEGTDGSVKVADLITGETVKIVGQDYQPYDQMYNATRYFRVVLEDGSQGWINAADLVEVPPVE